MADTVDKDVIDSLARKLAEFTDRLSADEQRAFHQFFLRRLEGEGEVEGYVGLPLPYIVEKALEDRRRYDAQFLRDLMWRSQRLR